jgi:IclR family mhp operon transcriptional activator
MQPKSVRALARGLTVLASLNRHGEASALELARETKLPRPTVYRVLQTLIEEGYVGRTVNDERFHLRMKVRGLSSGFEDAQWIAEVATPALVALTAKIFWPCDVSTPEGLKLIVRDTTHRVAPLSIERNVVGREMPMLRCAAGLAYIAFVSPQERAMLLALLTQTGDVTARDPALVQRLIADTQDQGYGLRQGGPVWPRSGAVALPIRHEGRVLGCINAVWMARVISAREGLDLCLEPLRETQALIESKLAEGFGGAAHYPSNPLPLPPVALEGAVGGLHGRAARSA